MKWSRKIGQPVKPSSSTREDCPARDFSDHLELEKVAPDDGEGAMRKGRFSEKQMVGILHEADKEP